MSKSGGNALDVDELLKQHGADVCRWWVASLNPDNDIKVDEAFFATAGEEYRKVRNTLRFLLSNLNDFDPTTDRRELTAEDVRTLDAWAMAELANLIGEVREAYERYQFRKLGPRLFTFCNDTLSQVYLAATKDRLYCDAIDSDRRRRTQTVMFDIADALIRLLAPIMPHTADEAWHALHGDAAASVHLATLPDSPAVVADPSLAKLMTDVRDELLRTLETQRQRLGVDNPLDLWVRVPGKVGGVDLAAYDPVDLADTLGVSRVTVGEVSEVEVVDASNQPRCERSWKRDGTVRERSDGGFLTDRDAAVVGM